jgi:hypothetical protein
MKEKKSILVICLAAGIGLLVLIVFATLLGVQVTAAQQQQTMPPDAHHTENNNNNQSGSSMAEEQQQNTTTATLSGMGMKNQTFNINWISLVIGVKVTGISVIDTEHIAVNLRYDGEGAPPGVSVVAVVVADITNSSSGTIIGSNMMQQDSMSEQEGETMRDMMIIAGNQQSNSSVEQESQEHDQEHQRKQNSTSTSNRAMPITSMQSGTNYLEAGWQGQESNSATLLVQLDGGIAEEAYIMVIVFPFLHR